MTVALPGKTYLVGGAVRDELLDLPVRERDWVVVGTTPGAMLAAGFRQVDPDFPVFLHPDTGEEYALARREFKIGAGYRGFRIEAGPDVTLQQDLARRDLTINAMARGSQGELIDPFKGESDLREGLLRHVGPAFIEDPVRLLRVARFAACLGEYGFRVAHPTHRLMKQMVRDGSMAELQPPRIMRELGKALACTQPWRFFEVLHACGGLRELLPGLAERMNSGHGDVPMNPALAALRSAIRQSDDPEIRLAALLLLLPDDHETLQSRLGLSRRISRWLRTGRPLWERLQDPGASNAEALESLLTAMGAWRDTGEFEALLTLFSVQPEAPALVASLEDLRRTASSIDIAALRQEGLQGADLGRAVIAARRAAIAASGA